ncbi:hypothetical protein pb186bvf_019384 [Paramecium bursaria]
MKINKTILDFQLQEDKKAYTELVLTNTTDQIVSFKIKITTPDLFTVKPSLGIVNQNQDTLISIITNTPIPDDFENNKFLIQFAQFPQDGILQTFWKQKDLVILQQEKLPCKIVARDKKRKMSLEDQQEIIRLQKELDEQYQKNQEEYDRLKKEHSDLKIIQQSILQKQKLLKEDSRISEIHLILAGVVGFVFSYLFI